MTRDTLLIRGRGVGAAELQLAADLAPVFGARIRFVVDAADGPAVVASEARARTIEMTPDWLDRRGLARFPGSGWRCGDYCYYAALDALPDLGHVWLIESDVRLSFADPAAFFDGLPEADFLAPQFWPRESNWFWTWSARAALGEGPVWGCLFPITRMSAAAIAHCVVDRAASQARAAAAATKKLRDDVPFPVPNDEAFVATTIARAGFDGRNLNRLRPAAFAADSFSWDAPLLPAEVALPAFADRVLHPVLPAEAARPKLALLRKRRPDRFAERREAAIAAVGQAAWDDWAGDEGRPVAGAEAGAQTGPEAGSQAGPGTGSPV